MTMTGAEARERDLEAQKLERMTPLQRRMVAIRTELANLDGVLDELTQKLDPVLTEGGVAGRVDAMQPETSSHGNDLARLADHLQTMVMRLQSLTERVDL